MQARNRTWINLLSVAAVLIGGAHVGSPAGASSIAEGARHGSVVQHAVASPAKAARLGEDMRKLWSDHVIWTRLYIVSAVDGLPDANAAAARLLKNQATSAERSRGFTAKTLATSSRACSNATS